MAQKQLIPKSKAKTAYGLLSEIRKIILAEPKRYDQTDWIERHADGPHAPACGTVCCVGGWVEVLRPGKYAAVRLGLSDTQEGELFSASAVPSRWSNLSYGGPMTLRAIRKHAKDGAAHIARFQKKYAKQLKAKRV